MITKLPHYDGNGRSQALPHNDQLSEPTQPVAHLQPRTHHIVHRDPGVIAENEWGGEDWSSMDLAQDVDGADFDADAFSGPSIQ